MAIKLKANMLVTVNVPMDERSYFGEVVEIDGSTIYVWLRHTRSVIGFPRRSVRPLVGAPPAPPLTATRRSPRKR